MGAWSVGCKVQVKVEAGSIDFKIALSQLRAQCTRQLRFWCCGARALPAGLGLMAARYPGIESSRREPNAFRIESTESTVLEVVGSCI